MAGKFLITGKARKVTKMVFPDEETKKQYQSTDNSGWTVTIVKVD